MFISELTTALFVMARLGGLILVLPVLSMGGLPKHVNVFAALGVSIIVAPTVPMIGFEPSMGTFIFGMAGEVAAGTLIGSGILAIFASLGYAGDIMGMQAGFALSAQFDPMLKSSEGAFGKLATWLAAACFVNSGLHLRAIELIAYSFQVLPVGTVGVPGPKAAMLLIEAVNNTILLGVQLAGPILVMIFLNNLFVALLTKLAPKMNVFFSIGMTMNAFAAMALFGFSLSWLLSAHIQYVELSLDWALRMVLALAS